MNPDAIKHGKEEGHDGPDEEEEEEEGAARPAGLLLSLDILAEAAEASPLLLERGTSGGARVGGRKRVSRSRRPAPASGRRSTAPLPPLFRSPIAGVRHLRHIHGDALGEERRLVLAVPPVRPELQGGRMAPADRRGTQATAPPLPLPLSLLLFFADLLLLWREQGPPMADQHPYRGDPL